MHRPPEPVPPGIEAAAIQTSKNVGIDLLPPLKGASCCPAPGAFGSIDLNVWYAMAARNVVLAEQMKMDIALICNGCYKSIWEVNHKLKHNDELRDGVNEVLKEIDMEFKGTVDVWHLAELYYDPQDRGRQEDCRQRQAPPDRREGRRPLRVPPDEAEQGAALREHRDPRCG